MNKLYTKLDFARLIRSDWSSFESISRVDDTGIWLLEESAPELRGLSDIERDLFLEHPVQNANNPVLPFNFTMDEFLKFAMLPAFELRDFYTFADNTVDVESIKKLERKHAPAAELARALMLGELPGLASTEETQGATASAQAVPVSAAGASTGVEPAKAQDAPKVTPETTDQRCTRLLCWFEEEEKKVKRGALARVTKRDGRARQTVKADIERAQKQRKEASNPIAMMGRKITF